MSVALATEAIPVPPAMVTVFPCVTDWADPESPATENAVIPVTFPVPTTEPLKYKEPPMLYRAFVVVPGADPDGIVSISSNQFTLQAGSYLIKAHAPAYKVGRHQIALYDITGSSYVQTGSSAYVDGGESVQTDSFLTARFTCSGANVYEIRHQCGTGFNTYGFGVSVLNSFVAPAENNYLTVLILKES